MNILYKYSKKTMIASSVTKPINDLQYFAVFRLREECHDVLYNSLELSNTKYLNKYVSKKEEIGSFAEMLIQHVCENMHESSFYTNGATI